VSDLATLSQQALDEVAASTTLAALDEVRVRWLGKKRPPHRAAQIFGRLACSREAGSGR